MLTYNVLNEYVEKMKKNDLAIVSTTDNIKTLTTSDINKLRAGDIVLKEDESGKHAYVVSYKKDGTGICLTYTDATYIETISYDYNNVTKEWAYNSMDATEVQPKLTAGDNVSITNNVISATDTTYTAGSGIDITDGVISATGGGSSSVLYQHNICFYLNDASISYNINVRIYNTSNTPMTFNDLLDYLRTNYIRYDQLLTATGFTFTATTENIVTGLYWDSNSLYAKSLQIGGHNNNDFIMQSSTYGSHMKDTIIQVL